MTRSASIGLFATSDEYEKFNSVSLFNIKNKRALMNQGRKETFGLMEMKKLHVSLYVPNTVNDNFYPTTETTTTSIPQRQKGMAKNMGSVGEEDQEYDEG